MQIKNEKNLTLLLILLLGVIVLAGVVLVTNNKKRSKPIVQPVIEKKATQVVEKKSREEKIKPEQQAGEKSDEGKLLLEWTNLDEVGFRVLHPADFPVTKRPLGDRFGSIMAYEFERTKVMNWNEFFLSEVVIYDKKSIQTGISQCPTRDRRCSEQELAGMDIYTDLTRAFQTKKDYKDYHFVILGQQQFFVNEQKCEGDRCFVRDYITFIGDKKIDIEVLRFESGVESQIDDLISQMVIQPMK